MSRRSRAVPTASVADAPNRDVSIVVDPNLMEHMHVFWQAFFNQPEPHPIDRIVRTVCCLGIAVWCLNNNKEDHLVQGIILYAAGFPWLATFVLVYTVFSYAVVNFIALFCLFIVVVAVFRAIEKMIPT